MGWKTLLLGFGMLFLVAACSGSAGSSETTASTGDSPEPTASSSVPAAGDTTGSGELLEGGRFVRLYVDPPTLDPHLTTDATSAQVIVEVFGGLVTIDKNLMLFQTLPKVGISQTTAAFTRSESVRTPSSMTASRSLRRMSAGRWNVLPTHSLRRPTLTNTWEI